MHMCIGCGADSKVSGLSRSLLVVSALLLTLIAAPGFAASSAGCDGGAFSLLGLSGDQRRIVPAPNVGSSFLVKGKYVEFTVDAATFGSGKQVMR